MRTNLGLWRLARTLATEVMVVSLLLVSSGVQGDQAAALPASAGALRSVTASGTPITIPQDSQPVTVDGVCDWEAEYSGAATYDLNDADGQSGSLYLKHDGSSLYVCYAGAAGAYSGRTVAVYLDADNGQEQTTDDDDYGLTIEIASGTTTGWMGNGKGYDQASLSGWSAAASYDPDKHDGAEFSIPMELTGGLCNLPFGLAVYHHWVSFVGDDYGWPSNQYYDQPSSWQTFQFGASPCYTTMDIADVPTEIHRRAAEHLENARGTEAAPGWELATLSPEVHPLYRPDVKGVAYYEFPVTVPSEGGKLAAKETYSGFIILSADIHDFPIAHWNFTGQSPTQELDGVALAAGKRAARYYKLDTLSYAAEDSIGRLVAEVGDQPLKITGLDPSWVTNPPGMTETTWQPDSHPEDDKDAGTISGTLTISGTAPLPIELSAWGSWNELKSGFGDSYGVLAERLRMDASADWRVEMSKTQSLVLYSGESYLMPLLAAPGNYSTSGSGVPYLHTETVTRPGLPDAVHLTALTVPPGQRFPVVVTVQYPSFAETVYITLIGRYTLSVPVLRNGPGGLTAQALPTSGNTTVVWASDAGPQLAQWSPWTQTWAGSHADQRKYNQFRGGDAPNTSSCNSGCGATAWAMLFGWADHQAALRNPVWLGRWGLYRQNGGYGADADAPLDMDAGVKNMTWEIHNHIGTWCAGSSGPTFPWEMWRAAYYLARRSPVRVDTHYNSIGWSEDRLHRYAATSIVNRRVPAIIGTGWLRHYPLAYGYAWTRRPTEWYEAGDWRYAIRFYVNNGWGGSNNGWVPNSTWFAGEIYP